jgi:glycosyltransferase involved in cell wall biosynthesis
MANFNISIMEKRKLNILFIATEYPSKKCPKFNNFGGQGSYLQNIANLLKKEKHEVSVYIVSNKFLNTIENGIKIRQFGFKINIPLLSKFSNFINYILISVYMTLKIYSENKKKKFDIIQYPSFINFGVILFFPNNCKKICRISGITKLWREYNNQNRNLIHIVSDFFEKRRVQQAYKVFAPSKIISNKASLEYSKKIYTLVSPLSIINKNIINMKKKKIKEKYLLYVGTLNRVKGTDLLANAILKTFKKHKYISLIISGRNDNLERNKNSIDYVIKKCKKFESRIRYLGVLPKKEVYNLYSNAEAIIIPSRLDNYPNVMIESILFKKPIIGFLNSSLDEVINHGKTGFLGDKQNSEYLFEKIDEFLSLSNSKKKILDKNILNLKKKLKSINYVKQLINFYNQN